MTEPCVPLEAPCLLECELAISLLYSYAQAVRLILHTYVDRSGMSSGTRTHPFASSSKNAWHLEWDELSDSDRSNQDESNENGWSVNNRSSQNEFSGNGWTEWHEDAWDNDVLFLTTLSPALAARIPLEVLEAIIDAMDQPTLAVAALVCTAWYPRVMHNLYSAVEIRNRTSFDMLFKQSRTSPRVIRSLVSTRILVASESDPKLARTKNPSAQERGRTRGFLHALPLAFGHIVPDVQVLRLEGPLRSMPFASKFFLALSQFKTLRSLHLTRCTLDNVSQLQRIVYAFSYLKELVLDGNNFTRLGSASPAGAILNHPQSDLQLQRLEVDLIRGAMQSRMIVDWAVDSGICTALEEMTVQCDGQSSPSIEPANRLLVAAGACLTRYTERGKTPYLHGNLEHNTALQRLDITLASVIRGGLLLDDWSKAADELRGALSTVHSYQLEHIGITTWIMLDDSDDGPHRSRNVVKKPDLRVLHEMMDRSYFDTVRLAGVKMQLYSPQIEGKTDVDDIGRRIRDAVRKWLRPWSSRGIVSVSWIAV